MLTVKSPLKAWAGSIGLPKPDDFDGVHWRVWKGAVNKPERKAYALTHLYCYGGLEVIKAAGAWDLNKKVGVDNSGDKPIDLFEPLPLEEVQAWENAPEDERIKLVAWLGKTVMGYMDDIVDPKE